MASGRPSNCIIHDNQPRTRDVHTWVWHSCDPDGSRCVVSVFHMPRRSKTDRRIRVLWLVVMDGLSKALTPLLVSLCLIPATDHTSVQYPISHSYPCRQVASHTSRLIAPLQLTSPARRGPTRRSDEASHTSHLTAPPQLTSAQLAVGPGARRCQAQE